MRSSYRFTVDGQVQGVGFRYSAQAQARRLGVSGWIGNRDDGRVEGVACGPAENLDAFRNWLRRGPPTARVETLEWSECSEAPDGAFEIRQ